MNYLDLGYNELFTREQPVNQITVEQLPQVPSVMIDKLLQEISLSMISGGRVQSNNGKLVIDLEKGEIVYNNGVKDLVFIGGEDDKVVINETT